MYNFVPSLPVNREVRRVREAEEMRRKENEVLVANVNRFSQARGKKLQILRESA